MKKNLSKALALVLAAIMIAALAVGCGRNNNNDDPPQDTGTQNNAQAPTGGGNDVTPPPAPPASTDWVRPENHITVELFGPHSVGAIGELGGWFGKMIYDRFNMTINQISAADGNNQLLWDTRSMARNLGDLIIINPEDLDDVVQMGLVMDITDMVDTMMPYYTSQFPAGLARARNLGQGRIYGLSTNVSTQPAGAAYVDGLQISRSPFIHQEKWLAVGAPPINTLEDLPGVLALMQEAFPYTENGDPVFGFTMWGDWCAHDVFFANLIWFDEMYGMRQWGNTGMIDPINQTYESVFDEDGLYKRALRMFFEANQLGLIDPDSPTQMSDTIWGKADGGQVMFSWHSWFGAGFNTEENVAQGIGMNFIPIMDQNILVGSIVPDGRGRAVIGIGSGADDPERLIAFLDWLSSPDVFQAVHAGPEGLTWEMVGGEPVLTPFGFEAGMHTQAPTEVAVPAEWGGSDFMLGSWRNFNMILRHRGWEINPNTGFTYDPRHWPSMGQAAASQLDVTWQNHFNSAGQTDFLRENNMLSSAPVHGIDFVAPEMSSDLELALTSIRSITRPAQWQMIFAADQAEFDALWANMITQIEGLGWQDLVARDRAHAEEYFALVNAYLAGSN